MDPMLIAFEAIRWGNLLDELPEFYNAFGLEPKLFK